MRIRHLILASLLCGAAAQAAPLKLAGIAYPLTAQLEKGSAAADGNALTMEARKGTDLYANFDGSESTDSAPRVLFAPKGDYIFTARVHAGFQKDFDGAALIVYADKTHWAKLLFENSLGGKRAISTTVTNKAGDDALHQTIEGDSVYLKIARRGRLHVFYSSTDGAKWRMIRTFAFPDDAHVQLGFLAQSPEGERLSARFSDIKLRAAAFKDYWQGE